MFPHFKERTKVNAFRQTFGLIGLVLGHKDWRGSVATRLKMLENVNGEFNERLGNEFLG